MKKLFIFSVTPVDYVKLIKADTTSRNKHAESIFHQIKLSKIPFAYCPKSEKKKFTQCQTFSLILYMYHESYFSIKFCSIFSFLFIVYL